MRYAFCLLALMAGTVFGNEIDATITGITVDEDFCSAAVFDTLFDKCVVKTAEGLGAVFHHHGRKLRSNRNLPSSSCSVCPPNPPKGHWCWVKCGHGTRRLILANVLHPVLSLVVDQVQLQLEARNCYQEEAADYQCLGISEDIEVNIDFTSE
jgi:hypothetical protein